MSTKEKPESSSGDKLSPKKPERRIIEPGMSAGTGSGFAMPMSVKILRSA